MKKRLLKGSVLLLCLFLIGCNPAQTKGKITEYEWVMENISNKSGKTLVSGESNSPPAELYSMILAFHEDRTFHLVDEMTEEEWKGTYTLERTTDSFKLDMLFDGTEEAFIGVYGTRVYQDGTTVPYVLFSTNNEILSFSGKE